MPGNRRNFLKSNVLGAIWAAFTGFPGMAASLGNRTNLAETDMKSLLNSYLQCLGGPFPEAVPLLPEIISTSRKKSYRIETVAYAVQSGERVTALLLIPDGANEINPVPGTAVWHQHNGEYHLGKSEPAGLAGNPMHHTGVALAEEGYAVLCPDALCFEERQDPTGILKGEAYERFEFLKQVVRGRCLAWKNILDMTRAIEYLGNRPEVIPDQLGCYGHSMGSTHAWLVGPVDTRLKCIIGNCCLPTYDAIENEHLLHCFPNFVPGWKEHGDTPEIASLIAPRALHLNLGENDDGSPIAFARQGISRIEEAYRKSGKHENFSCYIEPGAGHELTPAMWQQVRACFARHLKQS
jgi:dienelactone hydrolase